MNNASSALRNLGNTMTSSQVSNQLFKAAAIISVLALLAHELIGAPLVLPPLSDAGMDEEVIYLHHFSWHVGTVSVIAMAAMFYYASVRPGNIALAVAATSMSIGYWALAIGIALFSSSVMWSTPAPYFWGIIAVLGGAGIWMSVERNGT